jgi:hypothetical protein
MNHQAIAKALCGRYTALDERHGYLESQLTVPQDGTFLGAYLVQAAAGRIVITDDGDTLFAAAVAGADISKSRAEKYKAIAQECGVELSADGELRVTCDEGHAEYHLTRFFEAAERIAFTSAGHRPKPTDRFERLIGDVLAEIFPKRLTRGFKVPGASGHQLRFPFALDVDKGETVLVQTVAAKDGRVDWGNVYQAGGKFRDVMNNLSIHVRRIAVIEPADDEQINQARIALGDVADVVLYSGPKRLALAIMR